MQNYLCWKPEEVYNVINTEAEATPNEVFRAVHTPYDLCLRGGGEQAPLERLSPHDFIERFLQPSRRHMQVAVVGQSGSGKSHLVHWLRLNIRSDATRLVLTIPKAGTSLRQIIETIIDKLPTDQQQGFRKDLNAGGHDALTRAGQKSSLLNNLALAISEDTARGAIGQDTELEQELIRQLPNLFLDPYFRNEHFLRDGNFISTIIDHVFAAPNTYRPAEERREFQGQDLPLKMRDYTKAAADTQTLLDVLKFNESETIPLSLDIINRNLDRAIARSLSFSDDRLITLLTDLRRFLRSRQQQLILLIEDLARLQGLDRALLQALLEQGNDQLCDLRWAIAVTSGFFDKLDDTVKTRMTMVVDMDLPADEGQRSIIGRGDLARFTARYLNAARLGLSALTADAHDSWEAPVRSACESCAFRDACHSSFGEVDGFGLYPFTVDAVWIMAHKADPKLSEKFNPRLFQKRVLHPVLDTHADALRHGAFPPPRLLKDLNIEGRRELSVADFERLRETDPTNLDRRVTLLELWDGTGQIVDLPTGIHSAFELPALGIGSHPRAQQSGPVSPGQQSPTVKQSGSSTPPPDQRLEELAVWANGGKLSQSLATTLRQAVYALMETAIDWDREGLESRSFAAPNENRPFRQRYIYFVRQETSEPTGAGVRLRLPLNPDDGEEFNRTVLALQALLQFETDQSWMYRDGTASLVALLSMQEKWAEEIIRQFRTLRASTDTWDPVTASAELLSVGAVLAGDIAPSALNAPEVLNHFFVGWPSERPFEDPALKRVYGELQKKQEMLQRVIRAWSLGTKGGVTLGAFLDPLRLVPAIDDLQKSAWRLKQTAPAQDEAGINADLAKLYADTVSALEMASEREYKHRIGWLQTVEANFGMEARRADIRQKIEYVLAKANNEGLGGPTAPKLNQALQRFSDTQFDDAMRHARSFRNSTDPLSLLPSYGRTRANAVEATNDLIRALEQFLDTSQTALNARTQSLNDQGGADLDQNRQRIEQALTQMASQLKRMEG